MGAIFMDIDTLGAFAIYITAGMVATINHEASQSVCCGYMGEGGAEKAGSNYQIIILGLRHRLVLN